MKKIKNISLVLFIVLTIIFNLLILNKPSSAKEPKYCVQYYPEICWLDDLRLPHYIPYY